MGKLILILFDDQQLTVFLFNFFNKGTTFYKKTSVLIYFTGTSIKSDFNSIKRG